MRFHSNKYPNTNQDEDRHFFSVVAIGVSYWGALRRFLNNRIFRNDFQQLCRKRGDASKLVQGKYFFKQDVTKVSYILTYPLVLNKCIAPFQQENEELARENQQLQQLAFQRERELAEANDSCRRLHTANLELKESLQLQRPNVALLDEQNANSVMQIERGENNMPPSFCNVSNVSPCDESMCSHDVDSDDASMPGLQAVAIPKDLALDINKILRENSSIKSQLREYQNSYEILRLELETYTAARHQDDNLSELRDRLRRFHRAYETSPNTQCEDQPISLLTADKVTTKGGELVESIHRVWNDPENKGMILLDHATSLAIKDGLCRHHSPRVFCSHQDGKGVQCTNLAQSGGLCKRHRGKPCSHQDEKGVQCTLLAVKDGLCRRHAGLLCSHQDEKGVQCTNLARSGGFCNRHAGLLCSHQDEKGVQCTSLAIKDGLCRHHSPRVFCSHQDEKGVHCTNLAQSGGICKRHRGKLCSHQDEKGVQCTNLVNSGGLCIRHSPTVFCSHQDEKGEKCTNVARSGCGGLCRRHAGNYCSHVEEGVQCSNLANSGDLCNRHAGNFCSHVDSNGVKCTKLVQKGNLCRGHSRKGNPKDDRDYE